jgi:transcriptional regulator with AAA-type ATPase domain
VSRLLAFWLMRFFAAHSTSIYDRFYFLATAVVAYVAIAALQQVGPSPTPFVALVGAPLCLAFVWRYSERSEGREAGEVHPHALVALRVCAWGTALWWAARVGPVGRPGFDLAANVGVGSAAVAGSFALARIPPRHGSIPPPASARSLDAAAFCAALWGLASALPAGRALSFGEGFMLDPLATDYATSAASIASLLVAIAAALRARVTRRFELGVADRFAGSLTLSLAAFGIAVPAAAANLAAPDRVLPLGVLAAACACAWTASARESTLVTSALRAGLVVMILGAPAALITGTLAQRAPGAAGLIATAGGVACILVGLLARVVARTLAAEQSRWLEALRRASRACLVPEPNAAIAAALETLQQLQTDVRSRPELWRIEPSEVLSVDVAGYLHTEAGIVPPEVYRLAAGEPEGLLRRDVLSELEVKRPEMRSVLAWLEARDAFTVTLVHEDHNPLGLLLLPRGARTRPITLEEARAARQLAERLSAVLGLSSTLARFRERERLAEQRALELEAERSRLALLAAGTSGSRETLLEELAAGVTVATYSPRARATVELLNRLGQSASSVALEVPAGTDALGWACAFHLDSPRRGGPFVLVDAATALGADAAFWTDPDRSPLTRAESGTLVLANASALPLPLQDQLALALSRRNRLDEPERTAFTLLATLPVSPQQLVEERQLSRALSRYLLPNTVRLPVLFERAEDLRALVLDRLCRSGIRRAGEPLGIEPQALSVLVDYTWPGNEAELRLVIERAARAATGVRVGVADLARIGFEVEPAIAALSRPSEPTRRARSEVVASDPDLLEDRSARISARRRRRR